MVKNYILLGSPGVGKGTLAQLLVERLNLSHVSTGNLFRKHIKEKTKLGLQVSSTLNSGSYVSDKITNKIIKEILDYHVIQKKSFVLDGYPRTISQALFLEKNNYPIFKVILLEANDKIVHERLLTRAIKEKRRDDSPEVITSRIKIYQTKTQPLINYYQKLNLLLKIDASGSIEDNYQNVLKVLSD